LSAAGLQFYVNNHLQCHAITDLVYDGYRLMVESRSSSWQSDMTTSPENSSKIAQLLQMWNRIQDTRKQAPVITSAIGTPRDMQMPEANVHEERHPIAVNEPHAIYDETAPSENYRGTHPTASPGSHAATPGRGPPTPSNAPDYREHFHYAASPDAATSFQPSPRAPGYTQVVSPWSHRGEANAVSEVSRSRQSQSPPPPVPTGTPKIDLRRRMPPPVPGSYSARDGPHSVRDGSHSARDGPHSARDGSFSGRDGAAGLQASLLEQLYGRSSPPQSRQETPRSTMEPEQNHPDERSPVQKVTSGVPSSATPTPQTSYVRPTGPTPGSITAKRGSNTAASGSSSLSARTSAGTDRYNLRAPSTPRDLTKPTESSARRRLEAPQSARARLGARSPPPQVAAPRQNTQTPLSARSDTPRQNTQAPLSARSDRPTSRPVTVSPVAALTPRGPTVRSAPVSAQTTAMTSPTPSGTASPAASTMMAASSQAAASSRLAWQNAYASSRPRATRLAAR
jgi:hypothetical protein